MIDRQINGSQPEDGNPLDITFTAEESLLARDAIEATKQEIQKMLNQQVEGLNDLVEDLGIELQDKFLFKSGFLKAINAMREELEG